MTLSFTSKNKISCLDFNISCINLRSVNSRLQQLRNLRSVNSSLQQLRNLRSVNSILQQLRSFTSVNSRPQKLRSIRSVNSSLQPLRSIKSVNIADFENWEILVCLKIFYIFLRSADCNN